MIAEPPIVLPDNPLEVLSEEYREIVEKLVLYQDKYELPSEDDVARLAVRCHTMAHNYIKGGGSK